MHIMLHLNRVLLFSLAVLLPTLAIAEESVAPFPTSRTVRNLRGWTVRVDDRLFEEANAAVGESALRSLDERLAEITRILAEEQLVKLRRLKIVLDWSHGGLTNMQYHPDADWLLKNGYAIDLVRCVHLPIAEELLRPRQTNVQRWVVLHELAHSYHHQVLGFDEGRIKAAYHRYKASGNGEQSLLVTGKRVRHYGLTNEKEFFAEMTESYLGTNDFFPFNRAELKEAEPAIYKLMAEIWGPIKTRKKVQLADAKTEKRSPLQPGQASTVLWYDKPAKEWIEALPVGNGRLGATVFGGPHQERIQFNEETRWSGGPWQPEIRAGAAKLSEIRELIFAEKFHQAHKLFGRHLMGYPIEQQKYQSTGDLMIDFGPGEVDHYHRRLDLDSAVATTTFTRDGVTYNREVFATPMDQVIVVRLTADKPKAITFDAQFRGARNSMHSNYGTDYFTIDGLGDDRLLMKGRSSDYLGVKGALRYEAQVKAVADGGSVRVDGDSLKVTEADSATLVIAAATNFTNYKTLDADPHQRVEQTIHPAAAKPYAELLEDQLREHRQFFRRVKLDLGEGRASLLPTNKRLTQSNPKADPALAALVMQYGRYLLITSSRPGTQPANLQGIWNEEMNPNWDSKYTININTEMNYWPAEPGNLAECTEPLFTMIGELAETGAPVAKQNYDCRGWVAHQNTDLWRAAAPMDGANWGAFTVGGAWLTTHLWQHHLYGQDKEKLKSHYPLLKGSALFFLDFLVAHPKTGELVTCPSTSPENTPRSPGNPPFYEDLIGWQNPGTTLCAGATIDQQIVADIFDYFVEAATILEVDEPLRKQIAAARRKLAPSKIGKNGELQEWFDDWAQTAESHRHISHLYGLFPGSQITPNKTPELAKAAAAVLDQRGLTGNGWASAWKAACWARLGNAEQAITNFDYAMIRYTCPNLFSICANYPQVDGSFGFTAAIIEMLMQSHNGEIQLLPALPADRWPKGQVNGLRARGGFEIDIEWAEGELIVARLRSLNGSMCRLRTATPLQAVTPEGELIKQSAEGLLEFPTKGGGEYRLQPLGR